MPFGLGIDLPYSLMENYPHAARSMNVKLSLMIKTFDKSKDLGIIDVTL